MNQHRHPTVLIAAANRAEQALSRISDQRVTRKIN